MTTRRLALPALLGGLVLLVAVVAWFAVGPQRGTADPQAAAKTSFADLVPATGAPALASLAEVQPRPGTVAEATGPFDDRFRFTELTFDGRRLTGTTELTDDVGEILELETVAGFYDRDGALIGTDRDVYDLDESSRGSQAEGPPEREHRFSIAVPKELRGRAVAAAVGVPVLVNE